MEGQGKYGFVDSICKYQQRVLNGSYHDQEFHVGRFLFVFRLAEEVTLSDSTVPS